MFIDALTSCKILLVLCFILLPQTVLSFNFFFIFKYFMNLFLKQIALILVYTILFNYSNISLSKDKVDTSFKNIIIHQKSKDFPTLYLKNVKGEDIIISKYTKKVTLINFWATWCAPCIEELPSLNRLKSKYENNVDIIAINVEKINYKKAESFLKSLNVENFKTYFDKDFRIAKLLKLRGIPITIIVGQDGREVGRVIGSIEFDQDKFINLLKKI